MSIIHTSEDARVSLSKEAVTMPMRGGEHLSIPCMSVHMVKRSLVVANTWNPNSVASDRMELLRQSILDNGFCFPVVSIWDDDIEHFVVVDGFHRYTILGPDWLGCPYVPIVVLPHDMSKRLAATWQFNKARGTHAVELDADLIRSLLEQGVEEDKIAEKLGVDLDTVHRYKQVTGVAELFKNADYSLAWEMVDDEE